MGFYIETPSPRNKAQWLCDNLGGTMCSGVEAREAVEEGEGVVVVVHNPTFEAAGFAFDVAEFDRMAIDDGRPRDYVLIDFKVGAERAGYVVNPIVAPPETSPVEPSKTYPTPSPTSGVESILAVEAPSTSFNPLPEPKPTIHPHHFRVVESSPTPGVRHYVVTRLDPSSPWPGDQSLLKICDDGWESWLRDERPNHFGGSVTRDENVAHVDVYVD